MRRAAGTHAPLYVPGLDLFIKSGSTGVSAAVADHQLIAA
jgi:hypothetical protein